MSALVNVAFILIGGYIGFHALKAYHTIYNHPLSKYPGPKAAAASNTWHMVIEWFMGRSFLKVLQELHSTYGDIVRIGPNELHFANPQAYHDIYNSRNRWDKEEHLYHSFGEDRSSFGFLHYHEAKARKDVLNRTFAPREIVKAEPLVKEKVDALCDAFSDLAAKGKSADLNFAFRCMSMDVVTYLCFGKSVDAIQAPDFKAPIIVAMDEAMVTFVGFKHATWFKNMIINCPPKISRIISPGTAGLVDLQESIRASIAELGEKPVEGTTSFLPHDQTIFHSLRSPEAFKSGTAPSTDSLYEEAQALLFGGGDTTGNTLMVLFFHLMRRPEVMAKLQQEIRAAWPDLNRPAPSDRDLEKLPYLDAVIKEGLRFGNGVVAGLLRVVPKGGAIIVGETIPEGTIVSCASNFVHQDPKMFTNPTAFNPDRWLQNPGLKDSLVAFSKGPRSCLGLNLAWMELRLAVASVVRRFDLSLTEDSPEALQYVDRFLPWYTGPHVRANIKPIIA